MNIDASHEILKPGTSDRTVPSRQDDLLTKLNAAVAAANEAEAEHVSRSKKVGLLLLEAKKLHPAVKDFESFLKQVQGLHLSRAYDLMRLAGGRTTDEELKKEARERQQKSRADKTKLPKPTSALKKPEPNSVTSRNHDTERAGQKEVPIEDRKAEHAGLDLSAEQRAAKASARCLAEFAIACRTWLPKITIEADREKALELVLELMTRKPAEAA